MKAFEFEHRLIDSYARFSRSFSIIRSDDLKSEVEASRRDRRRSLPGSRRSTLWWGTNSFADILLFE